MYVLNIQLPSRGRVGESHAKVASPKVEHVREFLTFKGRFKTAINNIVSSLVDIDINKYPPGDRDFLFLNIRNLINEQPISVGYECSCGEGNVATKEVSELEIDQLPDDFEPILNIPLSKDYDGVETLKIRIFTVEMEELLDEYIDLRDSKDGDPAHKDLDEKDIQLFANYALMIDNGNSIDENIDFIRKLDFADFEKIMVYDLAFSCGPKLFLTTSCKTCRKLWKIKFHIDSGFLGISLEGLMKKHRFLAKTSDIGFSDFLKYTTQELDKMVTQEVDTKRKAREK